MNISDKTNPIRLLTTVSLLIMLALPLSAEVEEGRVFTSSSSSAKAISAVGGANAMGKTDSRFALKTNLLGYVALMPNIEVEWAFADRWSGAFEAQSAWWSKGSTNKIYRVATFTPEVRYWVIDRARWHGMYVGAFVGGGLYDLCNGKKGHKGEGVMAGISAGYMWPIGKHLSLDAGIGVGYMYTRDKVYIPFEGHYLYQLTKNFNYFGPLRAKLSLVWRFSK